MESRDGSNSARHGRGHSPLRVFAPRGNGSVGAPFQRLSRPHGVGHAVAEFSRACLIRLIDYPELPLRTNTHETIKAGRSALIVRTEFVVDGKPVAAAYKRVRRHGWLKRATALFRTNRGLRTFRLGHRLLARGIPTARPLAVIVPGRATRETYIATEWLEGATDLVTFCRRLEWETPAVQTRQVNAVAASLGRLLGRLHGARIAHRDLKGGNLLVRARGTMVETYVIDLDGAVERWHLSERERVKNLARLIAALAEFEFISRTARLRFLHAYLDAAALPLSRTTVLWRKLADVGRRVTEKKRRAAARRAA